MSSYIPPLLQPLQLTSAAMVFGISSAFINGIYRQSLDSKIVLPIISSVLYCFSLNTEILKLAFMGYGIGSAIGAIENCAGIIPHTNDTIKLLLTGVVMSLGYVALSAIPPVISSYNIYNNIGLNELISTSVLSFAMSSFENLIGSTVSNLPASLIYNMITGATTPNFINAMYDSFQSAINYNTRNQDVQDQGAHRG